MFKRILFTAAATASAIALLGGTLPAHTATATPAASRSAGKVTKVPCKGNATTCTATVSIAGGRGNEHVVVNLPSSRMRLVSVKPNRPDLRDGYMITKPHRRNGGRQYAFTLNAIEAPRGSVLRLSFHQRPQQVDCVGTATRCHAHVSIAGGASNKRLVVNLPSKGMRLVSVRPSRPDLRDGYMITKPRMRKNGHQYAFTLNAGEAAPRGSYLTLNFARAR
jgi:hypothetical protein